MKKVDVMITLVTSALLVMSIVLLSCGYKQISLSSNIDFTPRDGAGFGIKYNVDLSESEKIEYSGIISVLNAVQNENTSLASMVDPESSNGSGDYVYSGSKSFLGILDDFAQENYPKAKAMFPEMTVEEFYYHTAVGYSIANRYTAMQFLLTSDIESCKLDVTFDEVLIFGFWNSYYYFDDSRISNKTIDATIDTNVLDIPISLDYLVETQVKLRSFLYYLNSLKDKGDRIDVFVDDHIIDIINSTNNSANYTLSDNLFNEISAGSRFFSILLEDTLKQKSQIHFFVGNVCSASSRYFNTILPPGEIGSVHPLYYSTFILNSCFDSKIMFYELAEWIFENTNID